MACIIFWPVSWHLSFIAEIFVHGEIPKYLWLPCLSTALSSHESTFPLFATTQPYLSSLSDTQVSLLYFLVRWVNLFLLPGVVWCYLCTADGWWSPHSGIVFHICSFCLLRELKTMHHICIFCRWWCRIYCDIVCTWVLSSTVPLMKVISALFALYSFKCSSIHVWSHRLSSSQSKQCSGWPSWSYSLGLQLCYPVAGALAQWCCF